MFDVKFWNYIDKMLKCYKTCDLKPMNCSNRAILIRKRLINNKRKKKKTIDEAIKL